MMKKYLTTAAAVVVVSAGAASASTMVTIDFDSGTLSGGSYMEDGFTFTTDRNGGLSLANNCPVGGSGSGNTTCLLLNNNETVTATYSQGSFTLSSFQFSAPGNKGDITVRSSSGGDVEKTESESGNTLSTAIFGPDFNDISSFSVRNAENGSARVDNIVLHVAAVPVPAAGLLLLGAMGGLGLMRRRRKAA